MENQQRSGNDQVILMLPGIEKQWVRNKKGIWVDLESLRIDHLADDQSGVEDTLLQESTPLNHKKWWQFWK